MSTHKTLGYFDAKFDVRNPGKTSFRYVIFSSQRTGSNFLCARLCNLKDAYGIPMEYLHQHALESLGKRAAGQGGAGGKTGPANLADYLQQVEGLRTTADGKFGIKVQPWQLLPLVGNSLDGVVAFLSRFDSLVFMTRRDKLAQAVSCAIALKTGAWFNFSEEPNLDEADISGLFPLIGAMLARCIEEEELMLAATRRLAGKPLLQIRYEDIQHDRDAAFHRISAHLGAANAAELTEQVIVPITGKSSGRLAARIREEFTDYINGRRGNAPGATP